MADFGYVQTLQYAQRDSHITHTCRREDEKYVLITGASISICMCERVLSELTTANSWQEERVPNVSVRSGQGPRLPPLSPPSDFSLPSVPLVVNISSLRPGHVLTWLYLCLLDTSWTFGGFSTNVRKKKRK